MGRGPRRSEGEEQARAEASLREIEAGGLPLAAQERLREVGRRKRFFTSDLSTNEFLLTREAAFRPLTQVMGSCFYHVGWQWTPGSGGFGGGVNPVSGGAESWELETQTEAWNEARRLALGRLSEEARLCGADAVVGVRLTRGRYDWSQDVIEFVATGTAVASERYELHDTPVLSNLSGQEFAALFRHGFWPAGLVAGTTVLYVIAGPQQQQARFAFGGSRFQNQEFPDFTRGLYDARREAMLRATRQAHERGAHGLLGVSIETSHEEREVDLGGGAKRTDLVLTLHVLATSVFELEHKEEDPPVYVAVPLS